MNPAEFDRTFKLPFDEAVAWFRAKANVPTEHWAELEGAAHAKMFTSAGATHAELLSDLRKITDAAVAGETDIREFRKQFKPLVEKYGWQLRGGGPGWRSDLIWRTNIQTAYQAGRWQQFEEAGITHLKYVHNDSVRYPRPHHVAMDGTVLPITDPFWTVCYPPNGFGCKCMALPATKAEIASAGDTPKRPANWEHLPDANWNYNVGLAGKLRHEDVLGKKIASLPGDIATVLLDKLKGGAAPANDASFGKWIDYLLSDANKTETGIIKTTGEMHTLWFVEPDIAAGLKAVAAVELLTNLITITDRQAIHSLHLEDVRSGTGRPPGRIITVDDLKQLPRYLREPQAVLYDTSPRSLGLVYVFATGEEDSKGKWAVRINLQVKGAGITTNAVQSGAYVERDKLIGKQYILLRGSL